MRRALESSPSWAPLFFGLGGCHGIGVGRCVTQVCPERDVAAVRPDLDGRHGGTNGFRYFWEAEPAEPVQLDDFTMFGWQGGERARGLARCIRTLLPARPFEGLGHAIVFQGRFVAPLAAPKKFAFQVQRDGEN